MARNGSWRPRLPDDSSPPAFLQPHLTPTLRAASHRAREEQSGSLPEGEGPSLEPPGSRAQLLRRPQTADPGTGLLSVRHLILASRPRSLCQCPLPASMAGLVPGAQSRLCPEPRRKAAAETPLTGPFCSRAGAGRVCQGTGPRPRASRGKWECKHRKHTWGGSQRSTLGDHTGTGNS